MSRILFALLTLATLPLSANAMTCRLNDRNGDVYEASFLETREGYESKFTWNGVDFPALRSCMTFEHGAPLRLRGYRCPHGQDEIRFEVYPQFGVERGMTVIRWNGTQLLETVNTRDCQ